MSAAKSTDWKNEPLPTKRVTVCLDRRFSLAEMNSIRRGLVPEQMEDKWFVYWKDDTLFFHRSWTGFCIYAARFAKYGDQFKMTEADVNNDPRQHKAADAQSEAEMLSYLIDVLLLHKNANFPGNALSPETKALLNWSEVGRAMFGEGPDN